MMTTLFEEEANRKRKAKAEASALITKLSLLCSKREVLSRPTALITTRKLQYTEFYPNYNYLYLYAACFLKTKWCRSHAVAYSDPSEGPFVEQIMNLEFKHIAIASSQVIYLKTNHFSHAHAERRKAPLVFNIDT